MTITNHRSRLFIRLAALLLLMGGTMPLLVNAQQVTVPDVSGLTVPQAAAELNANQLRLGSQTPTADRTAEGQQPGTVVGQSAAAGQNVAPGTAVDLIILSDARVTLIYDNNDLTLRNQAGTPLDLTRIAFNSADGTRRFTAQNWRGSLDAGDCTQIWSISRREPKAVEGCDSTYWLTTNDPANHFWTQTAGVNEFTVVQGGQAVATCNAAPPNSQDAPVICDFLVLPESISSEVTEFVYFAYTQDRFAVINTSDTAWMPLTETPIYNFNPQISNPGVSVSLGNPDLFNNPDTVADIRRLAPGQCLLLTLAPLSDAAPPEECDVIAQRPLDPTVAFWVAPFELESPFSSEGRATCPAADPQRLTRCIMPR